MFRLTVITAVLTLSSGAFGHEGHAPKPMKVAELGQEEASARAGDEVKRLVSIKKVDGAWSGAAVKSLEKKTTHGNWEWVATFEAPNTKEKLLFVFLKPSGEFVAANFTGK